MFWFFVTESRAYQRSQSFDSVVLVCHDQAFTLEFITVSFGNRPVIPTSSNVNTDCTVVYSQRGSDEGATMGPAGRHNKQLISGQLQLVAHQWRGRPRQPIARGVPSCPLSLSALLHPRTFCTICGPSIRWFVVWLSPASGHNWCVSVLRYGFCSLWRRSSILRIVPGAHKTHKYRQFNSTNILYRFFNKILFRK